MGQAEKWIILLKKPVKIREENFFLDEKRKIKNSFCVIVGFNCHWMDKWMELDLKNQFSKCQLECDFFFLDQKFYFVFSANFALFNFAFMMFFHDVICSTLTSTIFVSKSWYNLDQEGN